MISNDQFKKTESCLSTESGLIVVRMRFKVPGARLKEDTAITSKTIWRLRGCVIPNSVQLRAVKTVVEVVKFLLNPIKEH